MSATWAPVLSEYDAGRSAMPLPLAIQISVFKGRVVRKPVSANPGIKVNRSIPFSYPKQFLLLLSCVVWDYSNLEMEDKQSKPEKPSSKSYNTEIKILSIPGLG